MMDESYELMYRMVHDLLMPGSRVVLLGPSGRGKAQFVKVACGYIGHQMIEIEVVDGIH